VGEHGGAARTGRAAGLGPGRARRAGFGDGVLVDFGHDPWELLECVPNYRDGVVSFNAGYVGMLRDLADLLRRLGHPTEAAASDVDADRLAGAVLGQYAGDGRWRIAHPDGDETIGHCLDFARVSADNLNARRSTAGQASCGTMWRRRAWAATIGQWERRGGESGTDG
jgi:hypothetical protein